MQIHHTKHHQGYINNLKAAAEKVGNIEPVVIIMELRREETKTGVVRKGKD